MGNNIALLDTQGWLALLNSSDAMHAEAGAAWQNLGQQGYRVLITDWIIAETGNGLPRTSGRDCFAQAVDVLVNSPRTRLYYVGDSLLRRAVCLYASRTDKAWGLIDCASFVLMEEHGVREAFTNDRHFEQAGFRCLLGQS